MRLKRTKYLTWVSLGDGAYQGTSLTGMTFLVYHRSKRWAIQRRNGGTETKKTAELAAWRADEIAKLANCPLLNPPNPEGKKRFDQRMTTYESMKHHQLHPVQHPQLMVTVTNSDNPYMDYPVSGVLHMHEIGTDLHVSQSVFHKLLDDGSLGPPVRMENVKFEYRGR